MIFSRAAFFCAAVMLVGCGSTGLVPGRDAQSREAVDELQLRVIELQRKAAVAELELARLRDRLVLLEAGGAPGDGATGGGMSDHQAPPDERPPTAMPTRPRRLPPPGESTPPVIEDDVLDEVDLEESMPTPAAVTTPAAPLSPPERPPVEAAPPVTANRAVSRAGRELYDQGYALFHQERYIDAESAFRQFLLDHGDTELADNAGYWIGESRFARADYRGALAAFQEAVERYPRGNKVPDSLLKAGRCLEELGDVETARQRYGGIVRRFPGTAAAAVAEDRLAALP